MVVIASLYLRPSHARLKLNEMILALMYVFVWNVQRISNPMNFITITRSLCEHLRERPQSQDPKQMPASLDIRTSGRFRTESSPEAQS